MILRETEIPGALVVEPEPVPDERGLFARIFDAGEFAARGLDDAFVQWSVSFNERAGTLRGLHFQREPHAETKLVRCTRGSLYDVVVDLRPDSTTFGRWTSVELSAKNRLALYIPKGLAHGFQTLEDGTEVVYAISEQYEPSAAAGVRWDDPALAIEWPPAERRIMSEKDASWPDFNP
ncbi:MAG TPA: dTDP-4-dehydrorhamnose 3,5-epimerase [Gaiellaceae bacterium]